MADILNPAFTNENKARQFLEAQRWPDGPVCPVCGQSETVSPLPPKGSLGAGWFHCNSCRDKFTVRVGTLYERSHVPLHKWLYATHLLCSSKKGISAHQLHRLLGVTYKTAWFMAHRIREGMKPTKPIALGGEGKIVEADATYQGKRERRSGPSTFVTGFGWVQPPPYDSIRKVVSLVERGGAVRSFHVDNVDKATVFKVLFTNADRKSVLMTDEAAVFQAPGAHYASHWTVNHGNEEYVRSTAYTNTVEGFFSIFKRGMKGVYQHCGSQHLHRYLAEFDFRYSNRQALGVNDEARTKKALQGIVGKRLTYRRPHEARVA
jgi:transposase-like protein